MGCPGVKEPQDNSYLPVAPPRLTSKMGKVRPLVPISWSEWNDTGGFHQHKNLEIDDFRPGKFRTDPGELALKTLPGVLNSAK
jgi:hypothetical protein